MCPDAWLLNYTNPMAMNIGYLAATHPDVKVLGLCHSVYWTVVDLCELVGVPFDEVDFRSAGVNHQAWILDWQLAGEDLYDRARHADRRRPRAATPGARRHVPAARLLPDRDQRALLGVRRRGTSTTTPRSSGCACPIRDYVGISAANVAETERLIAEASDG